MSWPRAAGLLLGTLADRMIPDPQRNHPVAVFGSWAQRVEALTWRRGGPREEGVRGLVHVGLCLAPLVVLGSAAESAGRRHPAAQLALTALATWAVTGGESLAREGEFIADRLAEGDLDAARGRLGHLCGRLADELDEPELARAALESVAENSADAVMAPLFWGAVAGVPGLLVHRGINTLDAMVGHRNDRYRHFGTAAARLDDVACWLPARLTGLVTCALAGDRRADAWRVMRRDARNHPSPNGGWCESAFAGALGVQLGGRNVYPGGRVEHRGLLGAGPRPRAEELRAAAAMARRVQVVAAAVAAGAVCAGALAARGVRGAGRLQAAAAVLARRAKQPGMATQAGMATQGGRTTQGGRKRQGGIPEPGAPARVSGRAGVRSSGARSGGGRGVRVGATSVLRPAAGATASTRTQIRGTTSTARTSTATSPDRAGTPAQFPSAVRPATAPREPAFWPTTGATPQTPLRLKRHATRPAEARGQRTILRVICGGGR